jgi:hypothetical protein
MATNTNIDQTCTLSESHAITPNDTTDIPGSWALAALGHMLAPEKQPALPLRVWA